MIAILRKEILENIRSYRFVILTVLLAALMFISILVSYGDYQLRLENYNVLKPQQPSPEKIIIPPPPFPSSSKGWMPISAVSWSFRPSALTCR